MWWKSAVATVAALATTLTFVTAAHADPPIVGAAHVAVSLADPEFRAATDSAGTVHGFADTAPTDNGARLTYFRTSKSSTASRPSPYIGHVLDVAWDGSDATYVVYSHGSTLAIAVHHDATASFSAPTVLSASYRFGGATVVASGGKWWVVWSESDGSHRVLFQRHTLLGSGERTHAVVTPAGHSDSEPSMTYSGGRATLVFIRRSTTSLYPATVELGTGTGGLFSTSTFFVADDNVDPDVAVAGSHTYVTWESDNRIWEKDNATGSWALHEFATGGIGASVALGTSHPYLAWTTLSERAFLADRSGGSWSGATVSGQGGYDAQVLAAGAAFAVVYATANDVRVRFS